MQNEFSDGILRSNKPRKFPKQNIWSYMKNVFKRDKQHLPAYVCSKTGKFYTYEQVSRGSANWAAVLKGLSQNSKPPPVVVLSPTTIEVHVVCLGSANFGSCVHMINYQLPSDVLQEFVEQSESDIIVTDISIVGFVESLLAKLKRKFRVFVCGVDSSDDRSIERILQNGSIGADFPDQKVDLGAPAFVFFSSGTTGRPKGTVVSHRAFVNLLIFAVEKLDFRMEENEDQKISVIVGNLAHSAPYFIATATIAERGKAVLVNSYDLESILSAVKEFKVMALFTWPSNLDKISKLDNASESIKSLKFVVSIGMPISSSVASSFLGCMPKDCQLKNWYGCTEAGFIGVCDIDQKDGNKFNPLPHTEVRIVNPQTRENLDKNVIGEIVLKTSCMMDGYFKSPEATKEVLDEEGWFHTGDSGFITDDKKFVFFERIKSMIDVNGVKVSSIAIEEAVMSHPEVIEAGVIGVADREAGELPHAYVVRASPKLSKEELIYYVDIRVKEHERLKGGVSFIDSMPRNHMGKIDRKILKFMSLEKQRF